MTQRVLARLFALLAVMLLWGGCGLQELREIGELGYFEFQKYDSREGVIVAAPHGRADPVAAEYAEWLSDQIGAGLVVGYGFGARRLPVARPLVLSTSSTLASRDPIRRGSLYREFNELLQETAGGRVNFYVGIRFAPEESHLESIEVATSGFSFEEIRLLKNFFLQIRDRTLRQSSVARISIAMEPLDKISWRVSGVKHHGVLMSAKRGLDLRLPRIIGTEPAKGVYKEILLSWVDVALNLAEHRPFSLPRMEVKLTDYGRIESIRSRNRRRGIVIAAPHGTFDEHTAEIVAQLSHRTGLAAVIAIGFTPTECGGWRINVNRPTERHYPTGEIEIQTNRAAEVYEQFKQAVLQISEGSLDLYIDVHQNGRQNHIEVATVGITKEQAKVIKQIYRQIRDRALQYMPEVEPVDLLIEPIDAIEIGAWAAKAKGILAVAKKSLHIELPAHRVLRTIEAREAYTKVLEAWLGRSADLILPPAERPLAVKTALNPLGIHSFDSINWAATSVSPFFFLSLWEGHR